MIDSHNHFQKRMNSAIRITEQKIFLKIQSETQPITGYTDITFESSTEAIPRVLFLNARQMTIQGVFFGNEEAKYDYIDTHAALEMNTGPLVRDAAHFSRVCQDVLNSPELIIQTPKQLPATVRIVYTINQDSTAFGKCNGILYTNNLLDGPSAWFPCIDGLGQRSNFTLEIAYPKQLVCVGPGKDLVIVSSEESANLNTVRYSFPYAIHPKDVGFALANFKSNQGAQNSSGVSIQYYFNQDEETFLHTMSPVPELIGEVSQLLLPDETILQSCNIVYIPELQELHSFPGLIFYPSSYIVPDGNAAAWVQIVPHLN